MATKQEVISMLDEINEESLDKVKKVIMFLKWDSSLEEEELTPEEIEELEHIMAMGEWISGAEIDKMIDEMADDED